MSIVIERAEDGTPVKVSSYVEVDGLTYDQVLACIERVRRALAPRIEAQPPQPVAPVRVRPDTITRMTALAVRVSPQVRGMIIL